MKTNSPPESSRVVSPVAASRTSIACERGVAVHGRHLGSEHHRDARPRRHLVDEVARHALFERVATAEDRHASGVVGEEQRRLPCRVARTDDMDVQPVGVRRLAARRAVRDALPDEPIEALDRQVPPRHAAGEHDRPGLQDVAVVEVHMAPRGIDARDRPGHDDFGAEPPRLLQRPGRQLVPGHARWEAEVVLDPRRRTRLPAGRLPFDDDRVQSLRGPIDGGSKPRRAAADDHRVVLRGGRFRCERQQARPPDGVEGARRSSRRRPE